MARPRGKSKVGLKVWITEETYAKVKLLLLDPLRGRMRAGELSELAESLFSRWANEQISAAPHQQETGT